MKQILFLFTIPFLFLFSCGKDNEKKEYFENGNVKSVILKLDDTVINNINYSYEYTMLFDEDGNLNREGKYINKYAIGEHIFYKNNKKHCVRDYIVLTELEITEVAYSQVYEENRDSLQLIQDSIFIDGLKNEIIHLNWAVYFSEDGDTIQKQSTYVDIKFKNTKIKFGDSIFADLKFSNGDYYINGLEIFFNIPHDTSSVFIMDGSGNSCQYSYKPRRTGKMSMSGISLIHGQKVDTDQDTVFSTIIVRFKKPYTVN